MYPAFNEDMRLIRRVLRRKYKLNLAEALKIEEKIKDLIKESVEKQGWK